VASLGLVCTIFSLLKPPLTVLISFVRGNIHACFPLFNIRSLKTLISVGIRWVSPMGWSAERYIGSLPPPEEGIAAWRDPMGAWVQVAGSLVELTINGDGSAPSTSICSYKVVTFSLWSRGLGRYDGSVTKPTSGAHTGAVSPPHRRQHLHPAWKPDLNRLPLHWHYWAAVYRNPPKGLQGCLVTEL